MASRVLSKLIKQPISAVGVEGRQISALYSSHAPHGVDPELLKPKYTSIHDIPDELVPTTSWRDPDNPVYRTRRFVNLRKKQILYAQDPHAPSYLKTKENRYLYYFTWAALVANGIYVLSVVKQIS